MFKNVLIPYSKLLSIIMIFDEIMCHDSKLNRPICSIWNLNIWYVYIYIYIHMSYVMINVHFASCFSSRLQETHSNEAPWKPSKLLNPWCFLPVICAPGKFAGKTGSSPVSAQKDSAISARSAWSLHLPGGKNETPNGRWFHPFSGGFRMGYFLGVGPKWRRQNSWKKIYPSIHRCSLWPRRKTPQLVDGWW